MDNNILIPQQLEVPTSPEVIQAKEDEELITSVVVTPAWQEVIDKLESKAGDKALCDKLRPLVTDLSVTDAQLGSTVRALFIAAKDVNDTISIVRDTVKAHEK